MTEEIITTRSCRPVRGSHGWSCDQWRSVEGEWFCGLCGLPLPPVSIGLKPSLGTSAPDGTKERYISVVCKRVTELRDGDLKDFELTVDISDPGEENDVLALPIDRSLTGGEMELGLEGLANREPFDIVVGLRHRRNTQAVCPVAVGHYDYPVPDLSLAPPGPIVLPRERAAFSARLAMSPASATALSARLDLPALRVEMPGRVEAASDGQLAVNFDPSAETWASVEKLQGPSSASLVLTFHGVQGAVSLNNIGVLRLTPPDLRLALAENARALTGRRARIAFLVRNTGGSTATIKAVKWTLTGTSTKTVTEGDFMEFAGRTLASQTEIHEELRPLLIGADCKPLPAALYRLVVEVIFDGDDSGVVKEFSVSKEADLEIRSEQVFAGKVCIDFGTTDTAAAFIAPGETYFFNRSTGRLPLPLELGRIGVLDRPPTYFLPTRATLGIDDKAKIATRFAEPIHRPESDPLTHVRTVDRLKWRLGVKAELEGYSEQVSVQQLAAGYLKHIRERIEEHPAIAARIERVVATRPARFGANTKMLIETFREAGMEVDLETFGEEVPPLVSESWPPVVVAVPFEEGAGSSASKRILHSLTQHFLSEPWQPLVDGERLLASPQYLCTFDIGGGSMDVSLLRVQIAGKQTRIADLAAFTSEAFAGEGFRDLIVREAMKFASGVPCGEFSAVARANLDAAREFASQIQHFPDGPFVQLRSNVEDFFSNFHEASEKNRMDILSHANLPLNQPWPPPEVPKALLNLYAIQLIRRETPCVLELQTEGAPLHVVFSDGTEAGDLPLRKLLFRIALRFAEAHDAAMTDVFHRLKARLDAESPNDDVMVLITGRGGMFPLAEGLVTVCAMSEFGVKRGKVHRLPGGAAKAVTSWGGLTLRTAREESTVLEFTGWGGAGYAVYGSASMDGARPRAALRRAGDGSIWCIPLRELPEDFKLTRRMMVCEDQGNVGDPEPLLTLDKFDLKAALRKAQDGWVIFDHANNVLKIGTPADVEANDA